MCISPKPAKYLFRILPAVRSDMQFTAQPEILSASAYHAGACEIIAHNRMASVYHILQNCTIYFVHFF